MAAEGATRFSLVMLRLLRIHKTATTTMTPTSTAPPPAAAPAIAGDEDDPAPDVAPNAGQVDSVLRENARPSVVKGTR